VNAYLLSGLVSRYQQGRFVDSCSTAILFGGDEARSRQTFQQMLTSDDSQENPGLTKIQKVVAAPVLEHLLTETDSNSANWPQIAAEIPQILESTPLDDQEHGYWVDCDQCVRSNNLPPDLERLKRELPEDIRSGLNWSSDKKYLFLISVLSPPPPFIEPSDDLEDERSQAGEDEHDSPDLAADQAQTSFPPLAAKELAVVVRARNSVVAAWLWRRHAASTEFARHAIQVEALCDLVPLGGQSSA